MTDLIPESTVTMGTWHHDHTIDFSAFEWQSVPVGSLQVGSRFRFEGHVKNPIDYVYFVVLHISNDQFFQVEVSECLDRKKIKKSFQEFSLKSFNTVLVIPDYEQSIALNGSKS